jgi:anti-anti-sigma factor
MHINVEHREDYAVLHLRGEFDTYYCRHLQEEIDALIEAGTVNAILNLRLVKFINSTALGAIIKASKSLGAHGGKLALSRPSAFCRDIIEKVGLDRVVPIYDNDEAAAREILSGQASPKGKHAGGGIPDEDESSVLFTPIDATRIEHFLTETKRFKQVVNPTHGHDFGKNWRGVGRMASLDEHGLRFTWGGGDTGLDVFAMGQLLSIGTVLKVKFRMPMFKPGYCEAEATVGEVEERDEAVKIGAAFSKIDDKTLDAVRQYAKDLEYLKDELKKATEG